MRNSAPHEKRTRESGWLPPWKNLRLPDRSTSKIRLNGNERFAETEPCPVETERAARQQHHHLRDQAGTRRASPFDFPKRSLGFRRELCRGSRLSPPYRKGPALLRGFF